MTCWVEVWKDTLWSRRDFLISNFLKTPSHASSACFLNSPPNLPKVDCTSDLLDWKKNTHFSAKNSKTISRNANFHYYNSSVRKIGNPEITLNLRISSSCSCLRILASSNAEPTSVTSGHIWTTFIEYENGVCKPGGLYLLYYRRTKWKRKGTPEAIRTLPPTTTKATFSLVEILLT